MTDPLHDPRVAAARSRVTSVERVMERNADPTCEATGASTAKMTIDGRMDPDGAPYGISATEVAAALDELPDSTQRLDVHINSRGGDAFEGLAILNRLAQADVEVHTHVDGIAASAASAIAMAGKTVTMAPSSTLMIHDAAGLAMGQAADMRVLAESLDVISDMYADAYAAKAGGTRAQWRALMQPETWYRADEAVSAGLADGIATGKTPASASFDLSIFAYAGRDAAPAPALPATPPMRIKFDPAALAAAVNTQAPAEPPETPPTDMKEVGDMADTIPTAGLRERLGVAEDADEATYLAALDEALAERAETAPTETAPTGLTEGQVAISADVLDELRIAAKAGQEARAVQLRQDRDDTIQAAVANGHIAPARRKHWADKWDADPEGVRASLGELTKGEPIYPVADMPGYAGTGDAIAGGDEEFYKSLFGADEKKASV